MHLTGQDRENKMFERCQPLNFKMNQLNWEFAADTCIWFRNVYKLQTWRETISLKDRVTSVNIVIISRNALF